MFHKMKSILIVAHDITNCEHTEEKLRKEKLEAKKTKSMKSEFLGENLITIISEKKWKDVKEKAKCIDKNLSAKLPLQILLAEDNLINQKLIIQLLNKMGYCPDTCTNGAEAILMLEKKKYDILFMDIQMPIIDGLEATKLSTIATSTTQAEFNALMIASKEIEFIKSLLESIQQTQKLPIEIYCDNQAAIAIAKGLSLNTRIKHYAIQVFYVRQQVDDKKIDPIYVKSAENVADVL